MPLAVTHILAAIILVELFREYVIKNNYAFPRYYILIAAIAGVVPDFDFALVYILYPFGFSIDALHKTFMHTLFVPLIFLIIGLITYKYQIKNINVTKHHMKIPMVFYILAAGSLLHLILDGLFAGAIMLFYPLSNYAIGLNLLALAPETLQGIIPATIDGILLLFWLFWLEFKIKVDNYF